MKSMIKFIKKSKLLNFLLFKIGTVILGLGINILIVKKITVQEYGEYTLIMATLSIVSIFAFQSLNGVMMTFGNKEKIKNGRYNKSFTACMLMIGMELFFSLIFLKIYILIYNLELNKFYLIFVILTLIRALTDFITQYFLIEEKQIFSSFLLFLSRIIGLILINYIKSLETLLNIQAIYEGFVLIGIFLIKKDRLVPVEFNREIFINSIKFSLWQLFGLLGVMGIQNLLNIIIEKKISLKELAIYGLAYRFYAVISNFAYMFVSYYYSEVVNAFENKNILKIKELYYKKRVYVIILSLIMHIIGYYILFYLIKFYYDNLYLNSLSILKILFLASFIRYIYTFYISYINSNGYNTIYQILNIFGGVLTVICSVILIDRYQILGIATAVLIGNILILILSLIIFEKKILKIVKRKVN